MRRRAAMLAAVAGLAMSTPLRAQPRQLELNTASRAELESLPGLGPQRVADLLAQRAQRPFADWQDLQARRLGLGAALCRRLSAAGLRIQGQAYPAGNAVPQAGASGITGSGSESESASLASSASAASAESTAPGRK